MKDGFFSGFIAKEPNEGRDNFRNKRLPRATSDAVAPSWRVSRVFRSSRAFATVESLTPANSNENGETFAVLQEFLRTSLSA